jgi:catechol 2,3-dioxygenase-like lactoylglutathione lyase family enzyme
MLLAMFDHVTIRVGDRAASERFYDTVLAALGIDRTYRTRWFTEWEDFSVTDAGDGDPPTRRLHVAFAAASREHVDAFWRAGVDAGYTDDGKPGPRPQYGPDYYGGFLLDPDGNSAEAVHHDTLRSGGWIDHLWIRVSDVDASRRFYETIAQYAGLFPGDGEPGRAQFRGASGSFSVLDGTPAENVHMAFGAHDNGTVRAFHDAATGAGYRDNGAPGERPEYHDGYFAAYVLDPDGNNVELVNHNRE